MSNTLIELYKRVTSSNYQYNQNYNRWLFYLESYMGGEEYRKGQHLTKYQLESEAEYRARLEVTPLDNHCRSVVNVYNSFMFREMPDREYGSLEAEPTVEDFLEDADLEGRSLDAVMKDVATWSSVFGHVWMLLSKPNIGANTLADEIADSVRPYLSIITPLTVYDWTYARGANGQYRLTYFKYVEDINDQITTVIEWWEDKIKTTQTDRKKKEVLSETEEPNQLGKIPVVIAYNQRSPVRGIGISDISDIADQQRAIYNELSEIEQAVRLDSHPTLVTPESVKVGTGAGAILYIPETMDPGLKPYILQNSGADVAAVYESIRNRIASIDKMANTGAVRATEARTMSGIAMQTEFQLLNARLSEKADNLELAEEQMWRLYAEYQGYSWDGEIEYPGSFNIHDSQGEFAQLQTAMSAATTPEAKAVIDYRVRELLDDPRCEYDLDEEGYELAEYQAEIDKLNAISEQIAANEQVQVMESVADGAETEQHATTTPENRQSHIQDMIMEGYTDEEILQIHSEITQADIRSAKEALLNLG
jgi:hypothetical protein